MEWKQAYDSGLLENTVQIVGSVYDLAALPEMAFYYTRSEASRAAALIGWPKSSVRKINLPLGRIRYGISDDHLNVLTRAGYNRLGAQSIRSSKRGS